MKLLYISSKVVRRIASLEKAGKPGRLLAQKATGIIDSLASGDVRSHMDVVERYTIDMDIDGDGYLQNLTDKDLRSIFNGLVEEGGHRPG